MSWILIFPVAGVLLLMPSAHAQDPSDHKKIATLERQVRVLQQEVAALKSVIKISNSRVTIQAQTPIELESGTTITIRSASTRIEGGGTLTLNGGIIRINGAGRPAARVGDMTAPGPPTGPYPIVTGSPTVLIGP